MTCVPPIIQGQVLTGPLFSEPMRVETVTANGPTTWVIGLVGVQSERFRKVTLTVGALERLAVLDTQHSFDGAGRLPRLGLQAYALGIAYEFGSPPKLRARGSTSKRVTSSSITTFVEEQCAQFSYADLGPAGRVWRGAATSGEISMDSQLNSRITCYALISCIEEDLRSIVRSSGQDLNITDLLPPDAREEALKRRRHDDRVNAFETDEADDFELLTYIDFLDLSKILHSKLSQHSAALGLDTKALSTCVDALGPTRNRVCHTRPLELEDVTRCLDTSDELLALSKSVFLSLGHTRKRLTQGLLHGLAAQIPAYWTVGGVENNLPLPDFDETNFLGRIDCFLKSAKLRSY